MARFEPFPEPSDRWMTLLGGELASYLRAWISLHGGDVPRPGLRESIQVWQLTEAYTSLSNAEATGVWHHQITLDGEPALYVRSRHSDEGEKGHPTWLITEIADAPLVALFARAVERLDQRPDLDDAVVRLLQFPRQQTIALWIHRENHLSDEIVLLQAPREVQQALEQEMLDEEVLPIPLGESAFLEGIQRMPDQFGLTASR